MSRFIPLDRRTFLRGAGASLALPLLDGMAPVARAATGAAAAGGQTAAPVRLAWVFFANGTNYREWKPTGEGAGWVASPTLEAINPLREDLLVLSGLAHANAASLGDGSGDHARSSAAFLTGAHPTKTAGAGIRAGQSVDQLAAQTLGLDTRLRSLELGTERGRTAGNCDSGYACAYANNIAWRSPTQPAAKEIDPRRAFERLFGGDGREGPERRRRAAQRKSILDVVSGQAASLRKRVGKEDRQKLDEFYQSVREVEWRIDQADRLAQQPGAQRPVTGAEPPPEKPADLTAHIRLLYDLMLLAFQTDSTRIATFMLANEGSNRRFPMIGVNSGHHELSHHKRAADKMRQIAKIDRYLVEQYAYFIRRLKETPEGRGTLLDNCAVVYGGAISDGDRHNHHDLPVLLAGRAGGALSPGRHLDYGGDTPMCNLFLSMLDAAGAPASEFGDSTGPLKRLAV
ncbi:MAG: DUF1552 domain-containing protein [Planctomycetota bacterium]